MRPPRPLLSAATWLRPTERPAKWLPLEKWLPPLKLLLPPPPSPPPPNPLASAALEARPAMAMVAAVARLRMIVRDMVVLRGLSSDIDWSGRPEKRFTPVVIDRSPASAAVPADL